MLLFGTLSFVLACTSTICLCNICSTTSACTFQDDSFSTTTWFECEKLGAAVFRCKIRVRNNVTCFSDFKHVSNVCPLTDLSSSFMYVCERNGICWKKCITHLMFVTPLCRIHRRTTFCSFKMPSAKISVLHCPMFSQFQLKLSMGVVSQKWQKRTFSSFHPTSAFAFCKNENFKYDQLQIDHWIGFKMIFNFSTDQALSQTSFLR